MIATFGLSSMVGITPASGDPMTFLTIQTEYNIENITCC